MAQSLARDEAGNVWDVSNPNSPRFVSAGQSPVHSAFGAPTLPFQGPTAAADLTGKTISNTKEGATLPFDIQTARNQAIKSGIDAKTAQVDLNMKTGTPPGDLSKTGQEYISSLPSGVRDLTQEMLNGNFKGSITSSRNPVVMQAALAAAHATNGNFDAGKYDERLSLIKNIASDPNSPLNALNTALAHAGVLYDQAGQVAGGTPFGHTPLSSAANAVENWWQGNSPAVANYEGTVGKYGPEQAKAYGIGTGGERQGIEQQYSINLPLDTKRSLLSNDARLYAGKIAAIAHGYDMIGGNNPLDYLSPDAKEALQKIDPQTYQKLFGGAGSQQQGPVPVSPPQMGGGNVPPMGGGNGPTPPSSGDGGLQQSVASGNMRTQYDPVTSAALSAMVRGGSSLDAANAYAESHGFGPLSTDPTTYAKDQEYAKTHSDWQAVAANKNIPTTPWQRFAASPVGAGIAASSAGATAGLSDVAGRAMFGPQWDANRQAMSDMHPMADLIGNVAGGTAAMALGGGALKGALTAGAKGGLGHNAVAWALSNPIKAGALGDAAYGAIYGASENPNDPLTGAGVGALTGAAGGMFGAGITKGAGAVLQGVADPAIQRLRAAGIPLTVGETIGGGFKKAQDALTSVFGPGNMVERRYADGRLAFNQAAFDQAGAPINAKIFGTGQQGIQALNAAKNNAYDAALNPVSLNLNTPSFINGMGGALQNAAQIPQGELPQGFATNAINRFVGNRIADDGTMTGPAFQQAYRGLAMTANRAAPKVEGYDIGQALGQAKDTLAQTLQEQNPTAYQGFLNANAANRNLNVLSNAVNAAKNQDGQLFTPAQLGTAATSSGKTFSGNIAAASGQRPFNQLAMDAQQVMSSRLPDSGTATRALVSGELLTNAGILGSLGAAGGMFGNQEGGTEGAAAGSVGLPAAALGLMTLLGTRGGQKFLTNALVNRTAADQLTGRLMLRNPQVGGYMLSAAGVPAISAQPGSF